MWNNVHKSAAKIYACLRSVTWYTEGLRIDGLGTGFGISGPNHFLTVVMGHKKPRDTVTRQTHKYPVAQTQMQFKANRTELTRYSSVGPRLLKYLKKRKADKFGKEVKKNAFYWTWLLLGFAKRPFKTSNQQMGGQQKCFPLPEHAKTKAGKGNNIRIA